MRGRHARLKYTGEDFQSRFSGSWVIEFPLDIMDRTVLHIRLDAAGQIALCGVTVHSVASANIDTDLVCGQCFKEAKALPVQVPATGERAVRPPITDRAAEYLAHRFADMREAEPRTKKETVTTTRFRGACEVMAALNVVGTNDTGVWLAVQDAYERCGPRPTGGDGNAAFPVARKEWAAAMTEAVIEEMRKIQ